MSRRQNLFASERQTSSGPSGAYTSSGRALAARARLSSSNHHVSSRPKTRDFGNGANTESSGFGFDKIGAGRESGCRQEGLSGSP
jgi:hypothetical protein